MNTTNKYGQNRREIFLHISLYEHKKEENQPSEGVKVSTSIYRLQKQRHGDQYRRP